jgi:DNA-binding beta-propeller fold protein YncE
MRWMLLVFMALIGLATWSQPARADSPLELFWQVPEDQEAGTSAGRMKNPRDAAVNPINGHVLVSSLGIARIEEFTAWGVFVKAWGFGVDTGAAKLEVCTAGSGCQEGIKGSAPGQMDNQTGIAVDSSGAVYVYEFGNNRVTKYSPEGKFLLMFGGNVNKTTGAEVCTQADVEGGDECGAGEPGSAPGFFESATIGNYIDISPSGTVYVGDKGRIQEFNPDGTFKGEIPFSGELAPLAGVSPFGLAVDPVSGDIYVSTNKEKEPIYRISPSGELVDEVEDTIQVESETKTFPTAAAGVAVDSDGNLYVVDHPPSVAFLGPFEVLKFSPAGECLICGQKFAQPDNLGFGGRALLGLATSDSCGIPGHDLYVTVFTGSISYLQAYGPAPQDVETCPPPEVAPDITDQFATEVGAEEAELKAKINPNFWNDTRYYVQYGPQECLDSEWTTGCSTEPAPPGALLTDKVLNGSLTTDAVVLEGLEPGVVYHYRFVAESSGGGPVFGVGGTETEDGDSSTFRTFPEALVGPACPNDAFRTGLGAFLPDCRAYEMVSPVDKDGGDITTQQSIRDYPAELDLSSLDGNTATYSSSTSFADAVSSPYSVQYLAKRTESGWQTHAISPPREELFRTAGKAELYELDLQFKRFSPDLDEAWLMQEADPPLDACGLEDYINWYRRDNSTDGYEAITTKKPATKETLTYFSEVQDASEDGTRTIFRANDRLEDLDGPVQAASITGYQLYEHIAGPDCGETRLVSVLPNGAANTQSASAGTAATGTSSFTFVESRENQVQGAVSDDASVIYWTAAGEGPGKIYVRVDGTETREVSAGTARFWQGSDDGSFAYYTEGEKLFRYDLAGNSKEEIAAQVVGLLGASEDSQRAYFVSKAAIGGEGTAGQPNLYLLEEGATTFIATLSQGDIDGSIPLRPANQIPTLRTSSVSEDGRFLAFTSDAALTGADNVDAASGLPDTEAYYYEADSDELRCLSCSYTGARPTGRVIEGFNNARQGYAARITPWKNQFHAPRVIAAEGAVVFFESLSRLVPRDTNGLQDVYIWRRAADQEACQATGAELYNPEAGGCVSLISSGTGGEEAQFVDSTPDASDAFFKTPVSLLPQDPNRIDLYDARVGGGFAPPTVSPECPSAEDCPTPVPPPPVSGPGTGGSGNPDLSACKALQAKAKKAAAKAARLRGKARRAAGARALKLKKQATKQQKKARRLSARAQSCFATAGGN